MDDVRVGQVEDAPAGTAHAVTPIGFLEEEEVVLVDQPHPLDHLAAREQTRPEHGLHLDRRLVVDPLARPALREQAPQDGLADDLGHERRRVVDAVLLAAVRVQELWADRAGVGVLVEEAHAGLEPAGQHDRVAVQEHCVSAAHDFQAAVVAGAEADVLRQREHACLGKLAHDRLDRGVGGAVVDHDHLVGQPELGVANRGETVEHEVADVPGDDHDREVDFVAHVASSSSTEPCQSLRESAARASASTRAGRSRVMQRWSIGQTFSWHGEHSTGSRKSLVRLRFKLV